MSGAVRWFQNLPKDDALRQLLPLQVQPNLPMLTEKNGIPVLEVPFYQMRPVRNRVICSPALSRGWFSLGDYRLLSMESMVAYRHEFAQQVLAGGDAIRRRASPVLSQYGGRSGEIG